MISASLRAKSAGSRGGGCPMAPISSSGWSSSEPWCSVLLFMFYGMPFLDYAWHTPGISGAKSVLHMRCSLYPNREGEGTCENDLRGQGSRALPRLPPRAVKREMFPRAAQEPVRSITTRRMHCSKTISEVFTGDAPNRDQALGLVAGGNQQSVSLDE
jgi:hypothetical protein